MIEEELNGVSYTELPQWNPILRQSRSFPTDFVIEFVILISCRRIGMIPVLAMGDQL